MLTKVIGRSLLRGDHCAGEDQDPFKIGYRTSEHLKGAANECTDFSHNMFSFGLLYERCHA